MMAAQKAAAASFSFVKDSINVGKSFDAAMSGVAATMGKSVDELKRTTGEVDTEFGHFEGNLRDYAKFLGQNTKFSATQAADA